MTPKNHTKLTVELQSSIFQALKSLAVANNVSLKTMVQRIILHELKEAEARGFVFSLPKEL